MKKNWMVLPLALLLVFGFVFSGCETYVFPTDPSTYTEVQLGPFTVQNTVNTAQQKGWIAVGSDVTKLDNMELTGVDVTLTFEQLQDAAFLVIEMKGAVSGGIDIFWGTSVKGYGWNQANVVSAGKAVEGLATFDDGVLTIDLAEAFASSYGAFLAQDENLFLGFQYWSPDLAALSLTKSYLLIPAPSDEFVPVTEITGFPTNAAIVDAVFTLSATYSPKSTAMKNDTPIIWTISPVSPIFEEGELNPAYDPTDPTSKKVISGDFAFDRDENTLVVGKPGTLIVTAIILGGSAVNAPFIRDFQVNVMDYTFPEGAIPLDPSMPEGDNRSQTGWNWGSTETADIKAAKYLVMEVTNEPEGGMQIIAQSSVSGWASVQIISDTGVPDKDYITITESEQITGYTIVIDLEAAFGEGGNLTNATGYINLKIQYYGKGSGSVDDLDVIVAYLLPAEDE